MKSRPEIERLSLIEVAKVSLVFGLWRVGLFVVGWVAPRFLEYKPSFPYSILLIDFNLPQWLFSWANFDGVHYKTIVQHGYLGTGLIQAFFPGYPSLVWFVNQVVDNVLLSGILVANIATLIFCLVFWWWLKSEFSTRIAWIGLVVLLLFPSSLFLGAMYSESLFLITVGISFMAARRQKWWLAGAMAAIASATRLVGIFLVPALVVELMTQILESTQLGTSSLSPKKKLQRLLKQLLTKYRLPLFWIMSGSLGLLAYMSYLYQVFDDALFFFHVQSEFGAGRSESLILYPQVVWRYIKILWTYLPRDLRYFAFVQEAVVGVGGALLLMITAGKVRWSYWVFSLGVFLLPTLTGTFSSLSRYILPCLVFWIWLAHRLSRAKPWVLALYLVCSGILLVINTILFVQGYWVA